MQITPRAVIVAAFGVGPLLLAAGCGGTTATGAQATLARIQPTSFVELPPATTTTTTTIAIDDLGAGSRSPVEQTYTIRAGDSISKIASQHDITMEQLVNYNSWSDGLDHFLVVGDPVKIPPGALIPGTGPAEAPSSGDAGDSGDSSGDESADAPSGEGCTHTIVQGENPSKVANQYDITVDELRAANPGGVMDTFLIGATLTIPPNGNC